MWLAGYTYRKRIEVTSTEPTPSGYQLRFRIGESVDSPNCDFHLNNNCSLFPPSENNSGDIAFTKSDGSTLLYLYVESVEGEAPNRVAVVWVRVDEDLSLGDGTTLYCYYGNSSASNISNPIQVFNFFDDFSTDTTANYKLTRVSSNKPIQGSYNNTEQRYDIDTGDDQSTVISPTTFQAQNTRVHAVINIGSCYPEGGCIALTIRDDGKDGYVGKIYAEEYTDNGNNFNTSETSPEVRERIFRTSLVIFSGYQFNLLQPTSSIPTLLPNNQTYHVSLGAYGSSIHLFINGQEIERIDENIQERNGSIGVGIEQGNGWIDKIFVTEFVYPEPTFNVGVEESQTPIIEEVVEVEDIVFVTRGVFIEETIEVEDSVSYYAYVRNEIESGYVIKEWHRVPYGILIKKDNNTEYTINVSPTNTSLYSICIRSANLSSYVSYLCKDTQFTYAIRTGQKVESDYYVRTEQHNVSSFQIELKVRHQSEYFIEEIFHTTKELEAKYKITDYETLFIENEARYEIGLEGVTAVGERLAGTVEPCLLYYDERNVHLHLYNTYEDERNAYTNSYIISSTNRNAYVERVLLSTERQISLERYYIEATERKGLYGSFILQTNERSAHTSSFATHISNRNIEARNKDTIETERTAHTICHYTDARTCYTKSWYVTERLFTAYGIPYTPVADQRLGWAQVHVTKYTIIRYCYVESCSIKLTYTVNPKWNEVIVEKELIPAWHVLFEDEQVTPYVNRYTQIPIPLLYQGVDLILIDERTKKVYNLANTGVCYVPVQQITTNTCEFKGYLVPRHTPLYIRMWFMFEENEEFTDPNEYYKHLIRHGYVKIVIDGEEISDSEALVKCIHPMSLIPIQIEILDELAYKFRVEFVWGYPYRALSKFRVLCLFYPTSST